LERFSQTAQKIGLKRLLDLSALAVFAAGFIVVLASLAQAAPARKLIKPGQLLIDGFQVKCGSTPAVISDSYPDFGAARRGLIILNPRKLRTLSRDAKLLIYYHECAHQYVGGGELAADCWAVQKVRREGLMNASGLKKACSFIEKLPANRRHPPGKMRCRLMTRCYNETFRAKADKGQTPLKESDISSLSNSGFSGVGISLKSMRKDEALK
jgi:hypothetical protein